VGVLLLGPQTWLRSFGRRRHAHLTPSRNQVSVFHPKRTKKVGCSPDHPASRSLTLNRPSHMLVRNAVPFRRYVPNFQYGGAMDLGYARVSTAKQDLDRQIDALQIAGIDPGRIWVDKKSGATVDRPGLRAVMEYARQGDVIVVHTLDRLGRTVRDTLNLIHELSGRGVGIRNLADPIKVDSGNPTDPMAQLAVVLLALFAQMERTYMLERAAHARAVATAKGRRSGRPTVVDPNKLDYARRLRDEGFTIAEIVEKTGITRTSLYRHLPPRPAALLTAAPGVRR